MGIAPTWRNAHQHQRYHLQLTGWPFHEYFVSFPYHFFCFWRAFAHRVNNLSPTTKIAQRRQRGELLEELACVCAPACVRLHGRACIRPHTLIPLTAWFSSILQIAPIEIAVRFYCTAHFQMDFPIKKGGFRGRTTRNPCKVYYLRKRLFAGICNRPFPFHWVDYSPKYNSYINILS